MGFCALWGLSFPAWFEAKSSYAKEFCQFEFILVWQTNCGDIAGNYWIPTGLKRQRRQLSWTTQSAYCWDHRRHLACLVHRSVAARRLFLRHFAPFLPSVNTFLAFVGICKLGTRALVCRVTAMRPRWAFLRNSTAINIVGAGKNRLPISWIVSLLQLYQFVKKLWLFGLKVCYKYVDLRHPWTFKTRTNFA